nr:hypothetical protein [Acinetobacter baumannii]
MAVDAQPVGFLNHLCDEEQIGFALVRTPWFLNHLCDEEPHTTLQQIEG